MSDETTLLVPGSGSHKAPTRRGGGVSYLRGNVSKNELKNKPTNPALQRKKKDPFFVPKTVDMLVQHPQGQAINLFFLINKSR